MCVFGFTISSIINLNYRTRERQESEPFTLSPFFLSKSSSSHTYTHDILSLPLLHSTYSEETPNGHQLCRDVSASIRRSEEQIGFCQVFSLSMEIVKNNCSGILGKGRNVHNRNTVGQKAE